jgi:hypothetical protein
MVTAVTEPAAEPESWTVAVAFVVFVMPLRVVAGRGRTLLDS